MKWSRQEGERARTVATGPSVLIVAGTRPEAIKLAPLVWALDGHRFLKAVVVNSGQHREAVRRTFAEFGIQCHVELEALPAMPNLITSFEHMRFEMREVAARFRPDLVMVQGDTLTAYAAAVGSRDTGCTVGHVEAGLRTDTPSDPFPEEWFRRRIGRIADLHFAPTHAAAQHLRAEGISLGAIHRTGNTGIDSLKWMLDRLAGEDTMPSRARRVLVTLHRRENHDRNADTVCRALLRLSRAHPELSIVFPVHPNPRVANPIRRHLGTNTAFHLVAPMAYGDFIRTAAGAALIISDSGGVQEEAPHLGTPLLVPRCNTERPEGIATGFVNLVRVDESAIVAAAHAALLSPKAPAVPIDGNAPFGAGDAAQRIVKVLEARVMERACA